MLVLQIYFTITFLVNVAQNIKFLKLKLGVFLESSSTSGQPQKYLYKMNYLQH
jgi:hypothetical protein